MHLINPVSLGKTDIKISKLGFGCMGLSEFYGDKHDQKTADELIAYALDNGVNFFDTADMYGSGHNETLLGKAITKYSRQRSVIATKFGIVREEGKYERTLSGKAKYVRKSCEESLKRLNTDYIDLYYIHRIDPDTPIEETIEAMGKLVSEGKIRAIGICEISKETLQKVQQVFPVSAVQSEYSMLTRDPEKEILDYTLNQKITFVPYSPICRGLLSDMNIETNDSKDVRSMFPRFKGEAYSKNKQLANELNEIAMQNKCSLAQLSLAWVLSRGDNIVPIPGTTKLKNLKSNIESAQINLSGQTISEINNILKNNTVAGDRYTSEGMKGVNL